ncbi:MAG TPA: hypothetical protein VLJ16_01405 [Acidobacteriota bacterium]|nr:hypothetical protein [Acidobacteriota bacterium]
MPAKTDFDRARTISMDFDGVLSSLVLGQTWEKTKERRKPVPVITPAVRAVKIGLAALTERLRRPLPRAEKAVRVLHTTRTLCLLTSRTGPRIAAAERWLARFGWTGLFETRFFNAEGEDADRFKARIIGANPIDLHVDDDPETIAYLAGLFPDRLFIHLNHYRRRSPAGANILAVGGWDEVEALFGPERPRPDKG